MQGGEDDFIAKLVNTMPHVDITDERRTARRQPARRRLRQRRASPVSGRARIAAASSTRPRRASWLESWIPGRMARSLKTQGVIRYSGRDVGAAIIGIDPQAEARVSSIVGDFRKAASSSLAAGGNNIVVGDTMAQPARRRARRHGDGGLLRRA